MSMCTLAIIRSAKAFVDQHPVYASAASTFLKGRPAVKGLRFIAATVSGDDRLGRVCCVTVKMQSRNSVLWIEIRDDGGKLVAKAVVDREKTA